MKREVLYNILCELCYNKDNGDYSINYAADLILDEMEKDKVLDKAGARDIEDLCNSVLGNCYLGKESEEELAEKIKASLRAAPAPASAVPGELP